MSKYVAVPVFTTVKSDTQRKLRKRVVYRVENSEEIIGVFSTMAVAEKAADDLNTSTCVAKTREKVRRVAIPLNSEIAGHVL